MAVSKKPLCRPRPCRRTLASRCPRQGRSSRAFLEGFSLEAGRHLHAHDRQGLEALCRYALRPPLALSRLSEAADGRLVLRLRRPAHDGTVAIAFTPLELLRRLAALVPPPRAHLVRYFGVFAPGSKLRSRLVPRPPPRRGGCRAPFHEEEPLGLDPLSSAPASLELRPRRLDWARLLRRVWGVEVLRCPCGGRRKIAAVVSHPEVAAQVLEALGVHAEAPPLAKARAPPAQLGFEPPVDDPGIDPSWPDSFDSHPEY